MAWLLTKDLEEERLEDQEQESLGKRHVGRSI